MVPIFIISNLAQNQKIIYQSDAISYFSAAKNGPEDQEYMHFQLDVGQKADVQVLFVMENSLWEKIVAFFNCLSIDYEHYLILILL